MLVYFFVLLTTLSFGPGADETPLFLGGGVSPYIIMEDHTRMMDSLLMQWAQNLPGRTVKALNLVNYSLQF